MSTTEQVVHSLSELLPTRTKKQQRWDRVAEVQVPDNAAVALVQGQPVVAGDVIRLYPTATHAKNPRPVIITVSAVAANSRGIVLKTDKGTFLFKYMYNQYSKNGEHELPAVETTDGKYKHFTPFRTHTGYLSWCQWSQQIYPMLEKVSLSLAHAGERQLPALEQLQKLLGEYIEAAKKS